MHEHIKIYNGKVPGNTGESKFDILRPYGDNLGEAYETLFNPSMHRNDMLGINTVVRLQHIPMGHVSDKMDDEPYIVPFIAPDSRKCVLICPGGAYCDVSMDNEGYPTAEFLMENGISSFVLKYRVWPYKYPTAFSDLKRAVCYIKHNADLFGIDGDKISLMGFSAGGNLIASTVFLHDTLPVPEGYELDEIDNEKFSVASIAPIYPEVCGDKALMSFQFGERINEDEEFCREICEKMYIPQYVRSDSPPAFLCACRDDSVVDPVNIIKMAEAYYKARAPFEVHLFTEGGHGFGVTQHNVPPMYGHNGFDMSGTRDWIRLYISWLNKTVK